MQLLHLLGFLEIGLVLTGLASTAPQLQRRETSLTSGVGETDASIGSAEVHEVQPSGRNVQLYARQETPATQYAVKEMQAEKRIVKRGRRGKKKKKKKKRKKVAAAQLAATGATGTNTGAGTGANTGTGNGTGGGTGAGTGGTTGDGEKKDGDKKDGERKPVTGGFVS